LHRVLVKGSSIAVRWADGITIACSNKIIFFIFLFHFVQAWCFLGIQCCLTCRDVREVDWHCFCYRSTNKRFITCIPNFWFSSFHGWWEENVKYYNDYDDDYDNITHNWFDIVRRSLYCAVYQCDSCRGVGGFNLRLEFSVEHFFESAALRKCAAFDEINKKRSSLSFSGGCYKKTYCKQK